MRFRIRPWHIPHDTAPKTAKDVLDMDTAADSSRFKITDAIHGPFSTLQLGSAGGEDHERRSQLPQAGSPENAPMSTTGRRRPLVGSEEAGWTAIQPLVLHVAGFVPTMRAEVGRCLSPVLAGVGVSPEASMLNNARETCLQLCCLFSATARQWQRSEVRWTSCQAT
jgi:hypothetical protein